MARMPAPPLVHVHAEALAHEQRDAHLTLFVPSTLGASVEDWVEALHAAEVEVMAEQQEAGYEVPPDETFADTEAVVVDASVQAVDDVHAS